MSEGTSVLFVDDHEGVRIAIAHLLELSGAQVTAVSSGSEALSLLEHERFDVVCTDLGLPEMDGGQLITIIRDRGIETPIVLISGSPQSRISQALRGKPKPQAVIGKPAGINELAETIKRLAHQHDSHQHEDSPRVAQVA